MALRQDKNHADQLKELIETELNSKDHRSTLQLDYFLHQIYYLINQSIIDPNIVITEKNPNKPDVKYNLLSGLCKLIQYRAKHGSLRVGNANIIIPF